MISNQTVLSSQPIRRVGIKTKRIATIEFFHICFCYWQVVLNTPEAFATQVDDRCLKNLGTVRKGLVVDTIDTSLL